jgi:Protein of unknown function (DUF2971)
VRVYYMTSANWGEVILRDRRLKLSRFYESNDPFELKLLDSRHHDTRRVAGIIAKYHNKHTGMICFTVSWRSPVMWAHYADKHAGVCLGFDVEDGLLTEVIYTDQKIKVPFGPHLPKYGLSAELLNRIISTKARDWAYEHEYRAMGSLKTQDPETGLYYTEFGPQVALAEVIIGYRCPWTTARTKLLIRSPDGPVRIRKARPAFGRFGMVEDKSIPVITVKPSGE